MNKTVSIDLPEGLAAELAPAAEEAGLTPDDLARESLRKYLWLRRFRAVRKEIVPQTRAAGLKTEEEVFREIS